MPRTEARTLAELRIENRALKRRVSRLEKQLRRTATREAELGDALEDLEEEPPPPPKRVDASKCPECESGNVRQFTTPSKTINACLACKHRF
jgi:hypothetical protein